MKKLATIAAVATLALTMAACGDDDDDDGGDDVSEVTDAVVPGS
ncbi:MAG TPA: hypothetical protein VFO97_01340 [Desertimonas sp.]|nr:hypothetical protein [Desertimonas sp.]